MSILGTRVVRVEDPLLLTVGGTYTEDLVDPRLTGALHATFVRSPLAHARVLSVDSSRACAATGVVAVLTAADLGLSTLPVMMPLFNPGMGAFPCCSARTSARDSSRKSLLHNHRAKAR